MPKKKEELFTKKLISCGFLVKEAYPSPSFVYYIYPKNNLNLQKYSEVWYHKWPTQRGIERQTSKHYKSFSFGLEILNSYWFNLIKHPKREEGVPQGSILSVTLFNIKINRITNCLNPGVDKYMFSDNFCIIATSKYICTAECQL